MTCNGGSDHDRSDSRLKALMALFPSGTGSFLRWQPTVDPNERKQTTTVRREPTPADYGDHLSPSSRPGPGAIGVKLSRPNGAGAWVCETIALDLDAIPVTELRETAVIDTLEGLGLQAYVGTGSTGRGCHLYVFLEETIPTDLAHAALLVVAQVIRDAVGPTPVELFPSNPRSAGKGIYLPYRGAGEDGLGANPILDPRTGYGPIPLEAAPKAIKRTPAALLAAISELRDEAIESSMVPQDESRTVGPGRSNLELFETEVARLRSHWRHGVRNNLVKGLTAYAVGGLKVEQRHVLAGIERLHRESGVVERSSETDLAEFHNAALATIGRHHSGALIAWRPFYQQAGVTPPKSVGRSDAHCLRLQALQSRCKTIHFAGCTALSDRALYETLIELAKRVGRLHDDDILVRVSRRDLALLANMSDNGARNAITRLKQRSLVKPLPGVHRGETGSLILVVPPGPANERTQSTPPVPSNESVTDWVRCFAHPAFRHSALGSLAGLVYDELRQAESGTLLVKQIAKQLCRRPYRLRQAIRRLVHYKVVSQDATNDSLTLSPNASDHLAAAAELTGANRCRSKQRERHEVERQAFEQLRSKRQMSIAAPRGRQSVQSSARR